VRHALSGDANTQIGRCGGSSEGRFFQKSMVDQEHRRDHQVNRMTESPGLLEGPLYRRGKKTREEKPQVAGEERWNSDSAEERGRRDGKKRGGLEMRGLKN